MPVDLGDDDSDESDDGLDDFAPDTTDKHVSDSGSGGSSSSSPSSRSTDAPLDSDADYVTPAEQSPETDEWQPKLDFSKPYAMIAQTRSGEYRCMKSDGWIIEDADSWKRLPELIDDEDVVQRTDDSPGHTLKDNEVWKKDIRPLHIWGSKSRWLTFCDLVENQFNMDAAELIEGDKSDVDQLLGIIPDVKWPPGKRPNITRECRVCGDTTDMPDVELVEIDLQRTRKAEVCPEHTVEELAEAGLLS